MPTITPTNDNYINPKNPHQTYDNTSPRITDGVELLPSTLPLSTSVVFETSSYFTRHHPNSSLPSPTEVRAEAIRKNPSQAKRYTPPPVHFPSLGLTVKYGRNVAISEGQCLWAIRNLLGNDVPVPEVYGWTTDCGLVYVYMEHIEGETLEAQWDYLSEVDKVDVCRQLHTMLAHLRRLKQAPTDPFIGNVGHGPLLDAIFTTSGAPPIGPLPTVKAFHDLYVRLPHLRPISPNDPPRLYRSHFPDTVPIVFTHGDLHRGNIIMSPRVDGARPSVAAIVDWHQSGWYPSYWEYCKARWTSHIGQEWEQKYLPMFLEQWQGYDYWDYFVLSMGV
ncbi:kinase-like protein [Ceratobasidium sp. AG-I]|nr:kinase-like protein [Ceratobasidium sp. AG-I]